jgi:hypothetical protein
MADIDLKTLTPDTSINDSAVLFGADSQASTSPSVYAVSTVRQHIVGTANTFTQPQIVSVSSSSDALRITQTGAGNALLVEDEANPDSTPFVVTANGDVLAGRSTSGIGAKLEVQNDTGNAHIAAFAVSDTIRPTTINVRFRAGATAVQSGDALGINQFRGFDGASTIIAAQISSEVDGTPGTNDMPGRLVFSTTADGAASPTERMRITSAGRVGIGTPSPSSILHVAGGSGSTIRNTASAGSSWFVGTNVDSYILHNESNTPMLFTTNSQERMRLTNVGNLLLGTAASPTTGDQCLTIETGTAPTATPADTISVYSSDLSAGNTILSLYTEGTPVNSNTTAAATHRIAVRINGTVYYLLANTAA